MPEYDPVQKISIVPRGAAGGLTFFAPSEERLESGLYSKCVLLACSPSHRGYACRQVKRGVLSSAAHLHPRLCIGECCTV
jgi:hypothetical protein